MKKIQKKITTILFFAAFNLALSINYSFALEDKVAQKDASLRPPVEYKSEGLRDPFQDYLERKKKEEITTQETTALLQPPILTVEGIIWGSAMPQAIINKKVVKIGDAIEGAKVTDISKDGVKIIFSDQEFLLSSPAASSGKENKDEKSLNIPAGPGIVAEQPIIPER